jgi:hypothetical protein
MECRKSLNNFFAFFLHLFRFKLIKISINFLKINRKIIQEYLFRIKIVLIQKDVRKFSKQKPSAAAAIVEMQNRAPSDWSMYSPARILTKN